MPEADDAKTKLAHKQFERGTSPLSSRDGPAGSGFSFPELQAGGLFRTRKYKKLLLYGLGIVLALLAVLAPSVFFQPPTATLRVGGMSYKLDIANTDTERALGLGGRASLSSDAGMVFVFDEAKPECFWMKDMHFPIDIIWLDASKQIVHIEKDVSPASYPVSYCPPEPAKYVIELAAGQAKKLDLKSGQTVSF